MSTISFRRSSAAAILLSVSLPCMAYAQSVDPEDEIIVTGSPLIRTIDETFTGVSVLSGDELEDRLAATIGETLKTEPGVSSTQFGAGASRPIIRGLGGDRVRVLTNGIGSIDASSASPDHAVAIEPAQAERIEVVRGASLLRYGSSGSGGIVNVIDGRIPQNMPGGGVDGAVRIGASSVDLGRETAGSIDYAIGSNLVLHLDGTWRQSDNYQIPGEAESGIFHMAEEAEHGEEEEEHDEHEHEGEEGMPDTGDLENSFAEQQSVSGGLSHVGHKGFLGFSVHRFESSYGLPGGHSHGEGHEHGGEDHDEDEHEDGEGHDEEEHGEEEGGVTIDLEQTRLDVNGAVNLDGFFERVQFFGGYADYEHTEFEPSGEAGTVFANEGYEVRLEAVQRKKSGWRAAYGAQYRERDFSAIGAEAFVPPTTTGQIGVYTFQELEFNDFHLEAAARFEKTDLENSTTEADRSFDLFSISGGGDVHMTEAVRVGGTVFRTERAPAAEELFSNGPHLATQQFEVGDPTLEKETATGIEGFFRYRGDSHSLTANVFYTDYDDYIYEIETGEEEDGLPVFRFVGEDATFRGFEVQGAADIAKVGNFNIRVDGLAEYVRAETDAGNLPRIPPLSLLGGIEAGSDRFRFRGEVDFAAKQDDVAANELPTESHALVNGFVTWKAPAGARDVRLNLAVLNILDEEARQHTSFLKDQVPLPGRNVRFSISSRF